jgi:hypothetical protein
MAVLSKLLSFPSLTLAACIEGFFAIKLFPNYHSSQSHLAAVATILLINYAFGAIFWVFLYPVLFSPLRRIPGPKVKSSFQRLLAIRKTDQAHLVGLPQCRSLLSRRERTTIR